MHNLPSKEFSFPDKFSTAEPDFSKGCLICGSSYPRLKNNGLERAHIFARGEVTNLPWNIVPLCPSCHQSFDSLLKPLIANAIQYASEGYYKNPSERDNPEKLVKEPVDKLIKSLRTYEPEETEATGISPAVSTSGASSAI